MTAPKTVALAALAAALLASAATAEARPHGRGMGPEVGFVQLLKYADGDKDGKVTPAELKTGADALFTRIDTDKDGVLTPGEMKVFQKARMEERRAFMQKARAAMKDDKAKDMAAAMDDGDGPDADGAMDGPKDGQKDGKHKGHHGMKGMKGMKGMHGGMRGAGPMLFRIADKDENGQISREEATAAADRLFKRMDRNQDGVVSIDDLP